MTTELKEVKKFDMMKGTGGNFDYLVIARKGNIGLGLKPNTISPGRTVETTYIGARLRSAVLPVTAESASSVVNLSHMTLTPETAWDDISWENNDATRSSTQIGMFVRGATHSQPELLLASFEKGDIATKMAEYAINLAGPEWVIRSKEEIAEWVTSVYAPEIKRVIRMGKANKALAEEIEEGMGTFGMQADLMKKFYNNLSDDVADIEDEEEEDNEDGEG